MTEQAPTQTNTAQGTSRLVFRNTMLLTMAQVLGVPLSILLNGVTARYLGAGALGYMYLGTTFNSFAFLAVDWGQGGALPALVATERENAGTLLGTSLVWRAIMMVIVLCGLNVACHILGYGLELRWAVSLVWVGYALGSVIDACQHTILGFERTDIAAIRQVFGSLVTILVVIPILMLGGSLIQSLVGHAAVMVIVAGYTWLAVRTTPIGALSFDRSTLKRLLQRGTPFVFITLAMVLQPNIDAIFLSKLSPPEVVGWHAASRKLIGALLFPVSALIGALYPTLCRLHASDELEFRRVASGALRATALLVLPIALCCAFYPDVGISIYSTTSFKPAEDNLRVLSLFLLIVYFTMPLGVCLIASQRQRIWAVVQSLCLVVSVVLDPLLVPWFQRRTGNGGLGICVAAVVSELIVLGCGVALAPRGVFDRALARVLLLALLAGAAMAGIAVALRGLSSFVSAPIALSAYVGVLWFTGAIEPSYVAAMRRFVERKILRRRQTSI
ncbi:MAG TPA: oligosaccharide flippase family protein [Polyangiaceae bacterium]|jgi:O-antigen/teichoic acid export membrane protein|nr:oligosaccharide flippase family protein [Polyangiaceae bacterium]